jgi:divinyl protochlorophyllide a 8-vinyl-reductase
MVDEQEFISLIGALRADMGLVVAGRVLARSGERTAAYLLANRIPSPARVVLPWLPRRLGLSILLKAISGHAWTFAGAGRFSYTVDGRGAVISLADSPECRGVAAAEPICHYYTHCFQALLRPLIDRRLNVREVACRAHGAEACLFEVR